MGFGQYDKRGTKNPNYRGGFAAKCPQCKKIVWVRPSRSSDKQHFCSRECSYLGMSKNRKGEKHWRYQGGDVPRTCEQCGKGFFQLRKSFNQSPGRFCSGSCRIEASKRQIRKTCECCHADYEAPAHRPNPRFCSQRCKNVSQVKQRTPEEIARKRLNKRVATLMNYSLWGKKNGCKWESLAGYTCSDLMKHLEALFQPGMSWENMGEWHIDHIRPQSSFSYATADDPAFRECWAMSNLQPLWKLDNLRKGSKYAA